MWNRLHDEMESDRATRYGSHSSKSRKSDWTGASFPAVEPDHPWLNCAVANVAPENNDQTAAG